MSNSVAIEQPWIHSARFDSIFILFPFFIGAIVIFFFRDYFKGYDDMPVWLWIVLSVASDRAHSWVTIYRVYFDFDEFKKNAKLFLILPFLCWVGGVVAYKIDSSVFWRCIAYFAVYHQVRQNYGFFAIYSRQEKFEKNWMMSFDRFVLYFVAFFPFLYWHLHPRTYTMFEGVEFVLFPTHHLDVILFSLFFGSLAFFLGKEIYLYKKRGKFNVPKNVLLLGTAISGFVGVVLFNNYVLYMLCINPAHAFPYLGLIWLYCHNKWTDRKTGKPKKVHYIPALFSPVYMIPSFLLLVVFFGLLEQGVWDGLVFRDHLDVLPQIFSKLPHLQNPEILKWIIPLLMLPVSTHYALDSVIWRFRKGHDSDLKLLFARTTQGSR